MPGAPPLDVRDLEEIAARTWRGLEEERSGDWLLRAGDPMFASVRPDPAPARPAAVARGAVEDGWLVITAVTVAEEFRRRGLARAVMATLAAAGRERGAHSCLLQVSEDNAPALALYARLAFTEHHRYHYRSAPA